MEKEWVCGTGVCVFSDVSELEPKSSQHQPLFCFSDLGESDESIDRRVFGVLMSN